MEDCERPLSSSASARIQSPSETVIDVVTSFEKEQFHGTDVMDSSSQDFSERAFSYLGI